MFDIGDLADLARRATPGIWRRSFDHVMVLDPRGGARDRPVCRGIGIPAALEPNLDFIAASHQLVPSLLGDLLRTRRERDEWQARAQAAEAQLERPGQRTA